MPYHHDAPELIDWQENSRSSGQRAFGLLPGLAVGALIGGLAFCRPRLHCSPNRLPWGYSPIYCSPQFLCMPRPCNPY